MDAFKRIVPVALAALLVLPAAPSRADAPDASRPPQTSGPLVSVPTTCEDNGPARGHEMKGQSCDWSYELVPAETDVDDDFEAWWIQIEVDPGKGWCAMDLSVEVSAPSDGRIVSAVPDHGGRIDNGAAAITSLLVDGGGSAPVPGTISQTVAPARGRTTVTLTDDHYSFRWRGHSKNKVMFAVGVQVAHGRTPLQLTYTQSGGFGFGGGSCRPMTLRVRAR